MKVNIEGTHNSLEIRSWLPFRETTGVYLLNFNQIENETLRSDPRMWDISYHTSCSDPRLKALHYLLHQLFHLLQHYFITFHYQTQTITKTKKRIVYSQTSTYVLLYIRTFDLRTIFYKRITLYTYSNSIYVLFFINVLLYIRTQIRFTYFVLHTQIWYTYFVLRTLNSIYVLWVC
jgi:hypothetical protein